ncbi:MAG TPA: TMEM165/GDT1 family protein [Gammaproteobacteria bacterium]
MQAASYITIFFAVLIAEFGDKTQLATLLFATNKQLHPVWVFIAAVSALIAATAIAVLAGSYAGKYLSMIPLKLFAGLGFIMIGVWTLYDYAVSSA